MTSQTKHFIELPDIVALQFECERCGGTVSLSLAKDMRLQMLRVCPNCDRPWMQLPSGSTAELSLQEFIEATKQLTALLGSGQFSGACLRLQIKAEAMPQARENK